MVMIPELRAAFCGCSLKTGSKVIGWCSLMGGILELVGILLLIGISEIMIAATSDEDLKKVIIEVLHKSQPTDVEDVQAQEAFNSFLKILVGNTDESRSHEVVGRQLRDLLQGVLFVAFLTVLVILFLHVVITTLLLVGVYKNKSGYVLFYLVLSVFSLIAVIPIFFNSMFSLNFKVLAAVGFFIHLYSIWVIYSFYKELCNSNNFMDHSKTVLLPGQKPLNGDVTILVPAVPNDYYCTKK